MKCQCDKRIMFFCLLLSLSSQAFSQVDGDLNSNPVDEAEARFLFINMLEFLGEFETEESGSAPISWATKPLLTWMAVLATTA